MDWKAEYRAKLMTAEAAVERIRSGDRVVIGHAVGEPTALVNAMVKNAENYKNVEIVHMVPMGDALYCQPGMEEHFRHNSLFVGATTRHAVADGRADFTPVFFSDIPDLFRTTLPVDVALVHLSVPDDHGFCSFGVSVDYTKPAAESAKRVIAQVNTEMPRTLGDSFIHISNLDAVVEVSEPIIELPLPKIGEVERAIGHNCATLIQDGDTLQLGIGAIPNAVMSFLEEKKDLGVHSEMFSDGAVALMEAGVITNRRKNFHPGKSVVTFLMGTKHLYEFVDNNPAIEMVSVDFVNNPGIIARNDNLIAINSCVQVDLMGQVVSSSVGLTQISGVGGQLDFVRGAKMSRGGKAIIAMPSTAGQGTISRIVSVVDHGAAVTTDRCDVDYVVTEWGIAPLHGRTLRDRATALIRIARPDFQDGLIEEFEKRFHERYVRL
jgi:4-hydroxybutyrate CoA-transferase